MEPIQLRPRAVVRLDDDGRLTIPDELKEAVGLKQGHVFTLLVDDGEIHIIPARTAIRKAQEAYRQLFPNGGGTVDEFIAERRAEAARESLE